MLRTQSRHVRLSLASLLTSSVLEEESALANHSESQPSHSHKDHHLPHYITITDALSLIMLITALSCSSFAAGTQASLIQNMGKKELTFNDLPMVVAGLRDEVAGQVPRGEPEEQRSDDRRGAE
jgi:hypothetical protein